VFFPGRLLAIDSDNAKVPKQEEAVSGMTLNAGVYMIAIELDK